MIASRQAGGPKPAGGHLCRCCAAPWARAWRTALLLLGLLAVSSTARAAGDPDLDWWTIETAHFRIHYESELEPVAERVARLAESIHNRLIGPMGRTPESITELVITDTTDSANGSASAYPYNTVRLFVTAPGDLSPLADYDDWYLSLLTHEYTHILHVDNISGVPSVVNAILGRTLVPNQIQPRWILEGWAVQAESRFTSGGRLRGSQFDMMLRADVIDDNIAGLDQISSNARRWPQGTLWYLYGAAFTGWIADVYGFDTWKAVSTDYGASLIPWGINRAIRRVTGRTYVQLYEGFKDHLRRRYRTQLREVHRRGLREGRRLTFDGRWSIYPRFLPQAARRGAAQHELLYYRNDYYHRPGLVHLSLGAPDSDSPVEQRVVARANGDGPAGIGPDGTVVFSSVVPYKNVYNRPDLFLLPPGTDAPSGEEAHRKRLTVGLRAAAPSISADGRRLAFTVNDRGTTTLYIADLSADGRLHNRRVLVPSTPFDQAYTPVFSPDGRRLAYSAWDRGGYRDVRIVELEGGKVHSVTRDRAMDRGPCWSPDGRHLYFSSDRTGIANIYRYSLADGSLKQVTNVRTGAFMPAVSGDGRLLVYVGYTSRGYDLYAMALEPERYLRALPPPGDRPDPPAEPPAVPFKRYRYQPLPTLRPYNYMFDYAPGSFGGNALTITAQGRDVVGHHALSGSIRVDSGAPLPEFTLDYRYGRLPFDLNVQLSNRVTPRAGFRINNTEPEYVERSYGLRSGISYTHRGEFASQTVGLSYRATILDADLPVASAGPLDPYAEPSSDPRDMGLIATVHLGYTVSLVEHSFVSAGPARGFYLTLGLDAGDQVTGSSESVYAASYRLQGYVPMPWPGAHTLAFRSSGAMSAGTYSRRGTYYVGGYDLERHDLLASVMDGVFNGAFALRGYPPGAYRGATYMLQNLEYRFPMTEPDFGPSTLPVYLRRVDGNLFLDYGGAWGTMDYESIELLHEGALIHADDLHTAAGAELWLGTTLAYLLDVQFRLGFAYGFSADALPGGQWYFVASSAF